MNKYKMEFLRILTYVVRIIYLVTWQDLDAPGSVVLLLLFFLHYQRDSRPGSLFIYMVIRVFLRKMSSEILKCVPKNVAKHSGATGRH